MHVLRFRCTYFCMYLETLSMAIYVLSFFRWLHTNKLTHIPQELGRLTSLKKLWLGSNQIKALPEGLGHLLNLQELYLEGNKLTSLPLDLAQLTQLRTLSLTDNPGLFVTGEVAGLPCMRGSAAAALVAGQ